MSQILLQYFSFSLSLFQVQSLAVLVLLGISLSNPVDASAQEGAPGENAGASIQVNQVVRAGDSISINVLDEPSISGNFKAGQDGAINYPLLGKLPVNGLTLEQIAALIETGLESDYIRDSVVSVSLSDRRESSVVLSGSIRRPGSVGFDPADGLNLSRAIALGGGADVTADTSKIEIRRAEAEDVQSLTLDLSDQPEFALKDADIVILKSKPEKVIDAGGSGVNGSQPAPRPMGRVIVTGEINRVGIVEVPLSGGSDILEVIALSGGFTKVARPSKVTVRRSVGGGETENIEVNVDKMRKAGGSGTFRVLSGDTIIVPESIF